jgi:hypothetical protein
MLFEIDADDAFLLKREITLFRVILVSIEPKNEKLGYNYITNINYKSCVRNLNVPIVLIYVDTFLSRMEDKKWNQN